ncbi:MAG TPA: DUF4352 domain-containing protein [Cyanobacteria bacterium UBA11149]|nr:DUF4352 domain-containing protein [Cyanobacteria bacterium UBA11367]HBE60994.1 DUF4352 domain-containing protein [Cyanobacteria bacterium UBA11366]HBK62889.1 DUF4352 domain-containing protein [Cyanobacteria bacterium UBA11166]HBR73777.1 DUF4352 domain-containing protein [Cyanobacteria bacterium UBA11159]HBS70141.1 DUF4352 domain-containing protein [Cyanobacteria bacterium UBA11153]HBW89068.1 DUF4352 domain-containing protein [Cyanobacteria bacterium UBA11149]HCA96760.1 DUF4352 domain-conta
MYIKLTKIKAFLAITIAIFLTSGCSHRDLTQSNHEKQSSNQNNLSQKTTVTPTTSALPEINYKLGDVIAIADDNINLKFTVNARRFHPGKGVIKPNQGNKWILVKMTIANQGKEPKKFSVISFALMDSQHKTYDVALLAGSLADVESPTGEINPGEKRQGEIAFEIPENAGELKLLFKPNSSICADAAKEQKVLPSVNCEAIVVKLD